MYSNRNLQSRFKRILLISLPVIGFTCLILITLVGFWWYELGARERFIFTDVLVLNQDIQRGTVLEESMLSLTKVEISKVIKNVVSNKEDIIGMAAKHFIPEKAQLNEMYFEVNELITSNELHVFKIPNEWIYSVPSTIRRKDRVYFYEFAIDTSQVNTNTNPKTNIILEDGEETQPPIQTFQEDILIRDEVKNKRPVFNTIVAYVKDQGNREVLTVGKLERYDGSSSVHDIEILATKDDFLILENSFKSGNKFVLMYSEGIEQHEVETN